MANRPRRKARKTARIYYGRDGESGEPLYWTVAVTDAKKTVHIDSTVADALAGKPGITIGCHLSKCAKRNAAAFPHDVKLASFTKGSCLIIDKIKGGEPAHAWRYIHQMGKLVELNDTDKDKRYVKTHPEMVQRKIALYRPYQYETSNRGQTSSSGIRHAGIKKSLIPRGALARARATGLINAELEF